MGMRHSCLKRMKKGENNVDSVDGTVRRAAKIPGRRLDHLLECWSHSARMDCAMVAFVHSHVALVCGW